MNVVHTSLAGLMIIEPRVFTDDRGFFMETWHRQRYMEAGIPEDFVQDNLSLSRRGTLRGLHYQHPRSQGKLVYVLQGEVYDVAVDIRVGSPTFGQWEGAVLSAENRRQYYIPPGFAHGFCVTSDVALLAYKCTDIYDAASEGAVRWNDPAIGINWPIAISTISSKDREAPLLKAVPLERLPRMK